MSDASGAARGASTSPDRPVPAQAVEGSIADVDGFAAPSPPGGEGGDGRPRDRLASVVSLLMHVRSVTKPRPRNCLRCDVAFDPAANPDAKRGHCTRCTHEMRDCAICSVDVAAGPGSPRRSADVDGARRKEPKALQTAAGDAALCPVCAARRPTVQRPTAPARRMKNVLALDGGGLRGVFTLVLLKKLRTVAGVPIRELFDLIIGCSAGGMLAAGLGILGFTEDDGIDLFLAMGTEAFRRRETKASRVADRIGVNTAPAFSHKYQHRALEKVLMQHLGHDTMMVSDSPKVALMAIKAGALAGLRVG